jgi:hypothetical protein
MGKCCLHKLICFKLCTDFLFLSLHCLARGLKGTSKAVYYRVLCNENYVFRPLGQASPLTKDVLQKLTYYMSFDYATATKAPRLIPVLLYSARLANVAMGYLNCEYK